MGQKLFYEREIIEQEQTLKGWLVLSKIEDQYTFTESSHQQESLELSQFSHQKPLGHDFELRQSVLVGPQIDYEWQEGESQPWLLLYAVLNLHDTSSLRLFKKENCDEECDKPVHDFFIRRRECLLNPDSDFLSFQLQVQDKNCKLRTKTVTLYVPESTKNTPPKPSLYSIKSFDQWVQALKVAQRPWWSPEEVVHCNQCLKKFGVFDRRHHCRRCGVAACNDCCRYWLTIHEYGHDQRVRHCKNCLEQLYLKKRNEQTNPNQPVYTTTKERNDTFLSYQPKIANERQTTMEPHSSTKGIDSPNDGLDPNSGELNSLGTSPKGKLNKFQSFPNASQRTKNRPGSNKISTNKRIQRSRPLRSIQSGSFLDKNLDQTANIIIDNDLQKSTFENINNTTRQSRRVKFDRSATRSVSSNVKKDQLQEGLLENYYQAKNQSEIKLNDLKQQSGNQKIELRYGRDRVDIATEDIKSSLIIYLP